MREDVSQICSIRQQEIAETEPKSLEDAADGAGKSNGDNRRECEYRADDEAGQDVSQIPDVPKTQKRLR